MQAEEIFIKDGKKVNPEAFRTDAEGVTHARRLTLDELAGIGITPLIIYERPDDFSDETHYRTEQDDAPYIVYTRKSDEQIEAARKARIQSQIDALESTTLLPRVTREFMLLQFAAVAASQGLDPMTNIGYAKVKELDDQITALRNQL